jgi:SAM-dependent methyltransferase
MVPLDYLALRLARRHLPQSITRALLHRGIFIKPGLETTSPDRATRRFIDCLAATGDAVTGKRVLIFGYGGGYGVGVGLLEAGAEHVVLLDPFAQPVDRINLGFASTGSPFLSAENGKAVPNPEYLTLIHTSLAEYLDRGGEPADLVLSNSVLEHVDGLAVVVPQLARATRPGGSQLHYVDMRDHFFKYPFEMLCHSERVWRHWLNPGSNLNRLRATNYERLFKTSFTDVQVEPLESYPEEFQAVKSRIRREFLTGDDARDAVVRILIRAK